MKPTLDLQIFDTLQKIDSRLNEIYSKNPLPGLLTGEMGVAIYNALQYKITQNESYQQNLEKLFSSVIEKTNNAEVSMTFADGFSGIFWAINYLEELEIIEKDEITDSKEIHHLLQSFIKNEIAVKNWDYLHGGLGAQLALQQVNPISLGEIPDLLESIKSSEGEFIFWEGKEYGDRINLSLSHGQISILYFLIQSYSFTKAEKARDQLVRVCNFYLDQMYDIEHSEYLFESFYKEKMASRLAWCYGDLTIGYMLYQAAMVLNDTHLEKKSIDILIHTTKRTNLEETLAIDASICHGTAGIALVYLETYKLTNLDIFQNAANFWMDETIRLLNENDYKFYDRYSDSWHNNDSLLEGLSGIGLVMLSFLDHPEFDHRWSNILLLK